MAFNLFKSNDITLNWKRIVKYCPQQVTTNLRGYTKEEIAKLLTIADLRDRCFILLMTSTGIRVGAIYGIPQMAFHLTTVITTGRVIFSTIPSDLYNIEGTFT